MGVHNTCLHFAGMQNWRLCLLPRHLSLQVGTWFLQFSLGPFRDRPYIQNLKEKTFWTEFGAKGLGLAKVGTKWVPLSLWAFWTWAFGNQANS